VTALAPPSAPALPAGGPIRRLADVLAGRALVADVYVEGAATYEALAGTDDAEVRMILLRARGLRGDVLDLGCGGGRLTLPLLARGHRVVALDRSPEMLEQLARRTADLPTRLAGRLEVREGDMAGLDLPGRRFDLVVLGTTTVTLLDEVDRVKTFEAVRRHLAPGGRFVVSTMWFEHRPAEDLVRLIPVVDGEHTTLVTMLEQVADDLSHRWVAFLVTGPVGAPLHPRLFVTRPGTLSEQRLRADLAAAGLRVLHADPLDVGMADRHTTLLTCVAEEAS
jgi:SAM-dependent methyltransferase